MRRDNRHNNIKGLREGKSVVIIGGGTSLKGFDFSKLDKEFTIAINHAIEHYSKANCLLFGDKIFLHKYNRDKFNFDEYKGLIFARDTCKGSEPFQSWGDRDNVYFFEGYRDEPIMNPKKGLFHPTSSGFMAMSLALQMKARRIYLLGFDYYKKNGEMHFFEDYDHHKKYEEYKLERKLAKVRKFEKYAGRFINCNPKSKIEIFKKIHWSEIWQ
ncbi:MAG: hypothetical protein JSW06_02705 [Thermoplasmatales archaeon]|nr:MAG: hypothetical protein JSW06_02705 [Thermoplasmatales archaeon]